MASVASEGGVGPHGQLGVFYSRRRRGAGASSSSMWTGGAVGRGGSMSDAAAFQGGRGVGPRARRAVHVPPTYPARGRGAGGAEVCSTLSFGLRTYDSKQLPRGGSRTSREGAGGARRRAWLATRRRWAPPTSPPRGRRPGRVAGRVGRRRRVRPLPRRQHEPRAPPVADDEDDDCGATPWPRPRAASASLRRRRPPAAGPRAPGAVGATALRGGACRRCPDAACLLVLMTSCRGPRRCPRGARGSGAGDPVFVAGVRSHRFLIFVCVSKTGFSTPLAGP